MSLLSTGCNVREQTGTISITLGISIVTAAKNMFHIQPLRRIYNVSHSRFILAGVVSTILYLQYQPLPSNQRILSFATHLPSYLGRYVCVIEDADILRSEV